MTKTTPTLKEYLQDHKLKDVAAAASVSEPYLSQIANGHRRPSPPVADRVCEATNGQVTKMSLLYPEQEAVEAGA